MTSGLNRRRRFLVLAICSMSLLMVSIDVTIVNVALPAIRRSLDASVSGLQWTIDAYTVVLASLLMLAGSTGDRIGRRRVFQTGLAVFSLASLLCAVAPTLELLVAARVLQAIGGSMLNPVALSIIRNVFDDPRERSQAIGVWAGVFGVSLALGPVLGGVLVDSVGWRWIFLVNVPIALLAILLTGLFVPESRALRARRPDPVGQVLVISGLATLTYAIIEGRTAGWMSAGILTLFAVAAASFAGLVSYERGRREPLVDVRFFRSAPFAGASATAILAFACVGGFLFLNTLYLQDARGLSPLHAGLLTLPMAAFTAAFAPLSGRLLGRYGARPSLTGGALAMAIASLMLTRLQADSSMAYLIVAYVLFGVGFGLVNPPITDTAVSGMPAAQAGVAAAIASTSRQVGATLGVAIIVPVAGAGVASPGGNAARFATSTHPAWWLLFALSGVILALGTITTTRWARETARRTAELFPPDGAAAARPAPEQHAAA